MRKLSNILFASLLTASMILTSCSNSSDSQKKADNKQTAEETQQNRVTDTLKLHYDEPAQYWEQNYLPIGNGYMGASIAGGISEETLVLNEKTLWTGGPSEDRPEYNGGNIENSSSALKEVQTALADKDSDKIDELMTKLTGGSDGYGAYQTFGMVYFKFQNIKKKGTKNYSRYLDLNQAVAGVTFEYNDTTYTKEYFANYPSNVIAMKFTAEGKDKLNFSVAWDDYTIQENAKLEISDSSIGYSGELTDNQMQYANRLQFIVNDGTAKAEKKALTIQDATEVVILFAASTDYANEYPTYRSNINPSDTITKNLTAAAKLGYDKLKEEHLKDYENLFGRANLNLGGTYTETCTDDLLNAYREHESGEDNSEDRYLEELYYQYGRYLLISSSREGSLPANLQGVWNLSNSPTWSSDYHINVNLQMNYWPAFVTNLAETSIPFVEYVDGLREPGRETAKDYYGIISDENNPENGWVAHTQSTPFGWTCPGWEYTWGWSSAATAWLDQNLWEYYQFTGDKSYLEEKIYPILKESAKFYTQFLIYDENQKRFVSSPTYSPEHGPVTIGDTYEQSLIQDLLQNFAKASEILNKDEELRKEASEMAEKMEPYQISTKTGFIKEWYEEDDDDFDDSDVEKNHRHTSHLLGLYPCNAINYDTPELLEAAKASLNDRGDEATGWARAMKVCLWSRTGDGNRSYSILRGLLTDSTHPNLWDVHPPFQIDGNFGATAGISEMLLQSHMGYIQILPSLPDTWKNGQFDGLCARNGFEVDVKWNNKQVTDLSILSKNGETCKIKIEECTVKASDGQTVSTEYKDGVLSFQTEKNTRYTLDVK